MTAGLHKGLVSVMLGKLKAASTIPSAFQLALNVQNDAVVTFLEACIVRRLAPKKLGQDYLWAHGSTEIAISS